MRLVAAIVILVWTSVPGLLLADGDPPDDAVSPAVIVVGNPALRASLQRIERGSATWRAEVTRAATTGRRIVVLTSDQVVVTDGGPEADVQSFDPGVLAEVSVIAGSGTRVDAVLVAVNLALLDETHRRLGSTLSQRDADLDRILVHEVYGHALSYVMAGDVSGRCADPAEGERAIDACAIRRENAVRAELRLGRRADSGLLSLALARGY
jgi:hypothetical protein